jgi:DNA-binding response OmpR family regulator
LWLTSICLAIARRARPIEPGFPVIYITAAHANEWHSQGVPNSVLLTKPFAPAQLVNAVSQLLNEGSGSVQAAPLAEFCPGTNGYADPLREGCGSQN